MYLVKGRSARDVLEGIAWREERTSLADFEAERERQCMMVCEDDVYNNFAVIEGNDGDIDNAQCPYMSLSTTLIISNGSTNYIGQRTAITDTKKEKTYRPAKRPKEYP